MTSNPVVYAPGLPQAYKHKVAHAGSVKVVRPYPLTSEYP